ncbi:MAG TPA: hypothetical protein VFT71_06290 [Candidatus Nitrosocosmicus sp.]|nr:hypothetical protein [Candidatus Nitrosocosmicus sp.]
MLTKIVTLIKEKEHEMLIKRSGSEITLNGAKIGFSDLSMSLANFSNKFIEFVKANEVATTLDNCQYHLSKTISNIKDNDNFKQECQRIRLMIIVAFHQLGQIIGTTKITSDENLKEQLTVWMAHMNDLIKHAISILEPGAKLVTKGPVYDQIMKYQGLTEKEMREAIESL